MMTETELENEQALVFLDLWGSTSGMLTPWEGYAYAEGSYCPERLESDLDGGAEPGDCVTVLRSMLGECRTPEGYRVVYRSGCGEKECPWCGDSYRGEDSPKREDCKLCEGDGTLYWGDDWEQVVFAPRYSYGSGSSGCLYDHGPHCATSVDNAIESLLEDFGDSLSEDEEETMRDALKKDGIHRFSDPAEACADYCEITDMGEGQ